MAVAEIIHFPALQDTAVDDTIQKAVQAFKDMKTPRNFVLSSHTQEKGAVQITSEWDGVDVKNYTAPESSSFVKSQSSVYGKPERHFHVALNRSLFGSDGPVTSRVVEYVQSWFPASRVTPEFQKQIEADFLRFDEIYTKGMKGSGTWANGWVLEEQEHEDIKGEKAKCFLVVRGWDSMEQFEQSIDNEFAKESLPILFAWKAPFKMWHVERRILNGSEVAA